MLRMVTLFSFILLSLMNYGQELSFSISPCLNTVSYYRFVAGGVNASPKLGLNTSLEYDLINDKKIGIGIGMAYQFSQVKINYPITDPGEDLVSRDESVNILTLGFKTIYKFKNEKYLSLVPLLSVQLKSSTQHSIDDQTGIGLSFAYGKKINLNEKFHLAIEPRMWIHGIIPFSDSNIPLRLTVAGIKLRIGLK